MELTQTQKMAFDSDDQEKSDVLSGEELLTQTQKMAFDSDDNMEILTPTALNALLNKEDVIDEREKSTDNTNKDNNNVIDKREKSTDNANKREKLNGFHYYYQDKNCKFYPPEIVRKF